MKKPKLFIALGCMLLGLGNYSIARENHFFQGIKRDSIPSNIFPRVKIYVKDLASDTGLEKALVIIGRRRVYTDENGYAVFDSVSVRTIINISKIGFLTQESKVKPELTIRLIKQEREVPLEDFTNGLYQRPLEHSAASYTVVDGAELRKVNAISFINVLRYYAPSFIVEENNYNGSDPNTPPSVKIRGAYNFPPSATIATHPGVASTNMQLGASTGDFVAGNINDPNQPVVVLNGVQVALQSVLDLDINRIERIVILKDAAATAAYGARAGNGVLLIQTQRPKSGMLNITYSGQVQIAKPDLSSYDLPGAADKLDFDAKAGLYAGNNTLYQNRLQQVNNGVNTNWLSIPTRTAAGQRHYLSIDGGGYDVGYGLDVSYNDMEGVMIGSSRKNLNLGGYLSAQINKVFVNNYLSFTQSKASNSPYGSFADYTRQNSFWDPYNPVTGGFKKILEQYTTPTDTVRFFNPAHNGNLSTTSTNDYLRLSDVFSVVWNIGHGFKLNGRISLSSQADEKNVYLPPSHTVFGNYSPDDFFKRGKYNQTSSEFLNAAGNLNLDYTKKIDRHQIYVAAGVMAQQTNSQSTGVELVGFTSDKLSDMAFGNAYSNTRPATGKITTRLVSGYSNVGYSFDDRYQLEGTINADESSQFSKNNRVAMHWSAGASWNLHQEHFFQPNKIISALRIYASVGITGNLFYQSYLGKTGFNYFTDRNYILSDASNKGNSGAGAYLAGFANDNLKAPETQKQNIGLDVSLFRNRLSLVVNAYRNKTSNLVLPVTSSPSTGFLNYSYYENGGGIENKGVEFDLGFQLIRNTRKKILWTVKVTGIHNEDRITTVTDYLQTMNNVSDAGTTNQTQPQPRYVAGESLTGIWAVRSLGIDPATGQEKFVKADGTETNSWNAADKVLAGDYSPKWQGSFGTSVTVKNWGADIYCFYQYGASYYNQTLADRVENANINYNVDNRALDNRWTQPGDNAIYKPVSVNGLASSPTYATTRFVQKNNYISNAVVSLRYSLPGAIAAKFKAKHAGVGLAANNLFRTGTMEAERGIYYPFNRTYTFSFTTAF